MTDNITSNNNNKIKKNEKKGTIVYNFSSF